MKIDKKTRTTQTSYWSVDVFEGSRKKTPPAQKFFQNLVNNLVLRKLGFEIRRVSNRYRLDQICYTKDENILKLRDEKIINFLLDFGARFEIQFDRDNLIKGLLTYNKLFREVGVSDFNGGMGYNNGLFFYLLLCHYEPKTVIESGVWRGYTTYLIDSATSDDSKIYCFDINLQRLQFKSSKASYFEQDLTLVDDVEYTGVDFAFFDDHVSIYDRLKLCAHNNIKVVVVDDDVSVTQVHSDGWPPIPTASMLYNYDAIPKKFSWITNLGTASADITGLEVGDICEAYRYVPFPKLDEFTGYRDSSFTSLLVRKGNP